MTPTFWIFSNQVKSFTEFFKSHRKMANKGFCHSNPAKKRGIDLKFNHFIVFIFFSWIKCMVPDSLPSCVILFIYFSVVYVCLMGVLRTCTPHNTLTHTHSNDQKQKSNLNTHNEFYGTNRIPSILLRFYFISLYSVNSFYSLNVVVVVVGQYWTFICDFQLFLSSFFIQKKSS